MIKTSLFCLLLIIIIPFKTIGINQNIKFKHITVEDGLSVSWVHTIVQDSCGFIWVGTHNGLNRYDGYTFVTYKNNINDKNCISNNSIKCLLEDSKGNFWIGTNKNLNRYQK